MLFSRGLFVVGSASRPKHRLELDTLGPYMTLYMAFICIALAGSLSTRLSLRFFAFHLTAGFGVFLEHVVPVFQNGHLLKIAVLVHQRVILEGDAIPPRRSRR